MILDPKAKPLQECILELRGKEKDVAFAMNNMVDIYNLPFTKDHVENLFEFPEIIVGEGWTFYKTIGGAGSGKKDSGAYYISEDVNDPRDILIPVIPPPRTISDFINDCSRFWKKDLVWDANLLKRKFKYEV